MWRGRATFGPLRWQEGRTSFLKKRSKKLSELDPAAGHPEQPNE